MADRKKNFTQFVEENGTKGIREVAIEYATSNNMTSMATISEERNISEAAVSKIIAYAFTHCIVSYDICLEIQAKAHRNHARHNGKDDQKDSIAKRHYDDLFKERTMFVRALRGEKVSNVVNYYISNPMLTIKSIANALGYSPAEINIILRNSIVFCIASDEEVQEILKIVDEKAPYNKKESVRKTMSNYLAYRRQYSEYSLHISVVQHQIDTFDDNYFEEEGGITLEELESQLKNLEKALEGFTRLF